MGQMHHFCLLDEMLVPRASECAASICLYSPSCREGLFSETKLPPNIVLGNSEDQRALKEGRGVDTPALAHTPRLVKPAPLSRRHKPPGYLLSERTCSCSLASAWNFAPYIPARLEPTTSDPEALDRTLAPSHTAANWRSLLRILEGASFTSSFASVTISSVVTMISSAGVISFASSATSVVMSGLMPLAASVIRCPTLSPP